MKDEKCLFSPLVYILYPYENHRVPQSINVPCKPSQELCKNAVLFTRIIAIKKYLQCLPISLITF